MQSQATMKRHLTRLLTATIIFSLEFIYRALGLTGTFLIIGAFNRCNHFSVGRASMMNNKWVSGITALLLSAALTGCMGGTSKEGAGGGQASASPAPTTVQPSTAAPTPIASAAVPSKAPQAKPDYAKEEDAKAAIADKAKETIEAIKNKDMKKLSELVHPELGVQFTPYAYIDPKKDVRVKPGELAALWQNSGKKIWGSFDGSGEPIELSFQGYYSKFIYNHDFASAKKIGYNRTLGKGNTVNNLFELYPTNKFITVEYHFEGFDPKYEGQDWASLRLVFAPYKDDWKLAAVVHDQWTI